MPSTRDIRRRIKSVKNTAQITKAMQMVAAAKMRKAQQAALAGRPYADLMNHVLAEAAPRIATLKNGLRFSVEIRTELRERRQLAELREVAFDAARDLFHRLDLRG